MTWLAQARHVLLKDVRQSRRMLIVYVALVALVTAQSLIAPNGIVNGGFGMFVVVLFAMLFGAAIVQNDSPTRSNAFWATRPFYPSAVLAGKIGFAVLVLLLIPGIGQIFALHAFGVSSYEAFRLAFVGMLLLGTWLLLALMIGAVTEDTRSFLVAIAGVVVFGVVVAAIVATHSGAIAVTLSTTSRPFAIACAILAPIATIAFLGYLYATRDGRRRTWAAIAALTLALFEALAMPEPVSSYDVRSVQPRQFHLEIAQPERIAVDHSLSIRLSVEGALPSEQFTIVSDTVVVHLKDGSIMEIPTPFTREIVHEAVLPTARPATLSLKPSRAQTGFSTVQTNAEQAQRLEHGVSRVEMRATILVTSPTLRAEVPIAPGTIVTKDGERINFAKVARGETFVAADVVTRSLDVGAKRTSFPLVDMTTLAVVNDQGGEAVPFVRRSSNGGAGWLVLPGVSINSDSAHYETPNGRQPFTPSADWFRSARLAVIGWNTVGTYQATAEASVP